MSVWEKFTSWFGVDHPNMVEHELFGLALHPFDLATNKVLALVGRLEVRDWLDVIECDERLQPLGYLAWAACGKDPGFSPRAILEYAGRSSHYSADEVSTLEFSGQTPDVGELSRRWRASLSTARELLQVLPVEQVGKCVLDANGALFQGGVDALRDALQRGVLRFHAGHIGGALPRVVGS